MYILEMQSQGIGGPVGTIGAFHTLEDAKLAMSMQVGFPTEWTEQPDGSFTFDWSLIDYTISEV